MRRTIAVIVLCGATIGMLVACGGGGAADAQKLAAQAAAGNEAFERREFDNAFRMLRPIAEQGDAEAQFRVGFMYFHGRGAERDFASGMDWLAKAAAQGHAEAQYHLALAHARPGADQDLVQAHVYASLAAQQGYKAAEDVKADVAGQMTEEQTREARKRAAEWRASR